MISDNGVDFTQVAANSSLNSSVVIDEVSTAAEAYDSNSTNSTNINNNSTTNGTNNGTNSNSSTTNANNTNSTNGNFAFKGIEILGIWMIAILVLGVF